MSASGSPPTPDVAREVVAPYPVDVPAVLEPFQRGRHDPAQVIDGHGVVWRTTRTPEGPATLRLAVASRARDSAVVSCGAWGPGAEWAVARVPGLLGFADDPAGFPHHLLPRALQRAWERHGRRMRTPRSERVLEALVCAVLEQKVTGVQSRRAWRSLLVEAGEPAPGPVPRPMSVFPTVAALRAVPSWQWHRWGVEPQLSATALRVAGVAGRVEQCVGLPVADARRRLAAIPGIGVWSIAEASQRALGDPDALSLGDYHLANEVVFAFTGERNGTDDQMVALLAPFAGHRYRVQQLVGLSGLTRPRRGPRITIADHRRH